MTGLIWQKNLLPRTGPGPGFHPSSDCTDQLGEVNALKISWLRYSLSLGWRRWRKRFPFPIWLNVFLYSFSYNYFHNTRHHEQRFMWNTNKNLLEENVVTPLTGYLLKRPLRALLDPSPKILSPAVLLQPNKLPSIKFHSFGLR